MEKTKRYRFFHKIYLFLGTALFAYLAVTLSYYNVLVNIDQQISDAIFQSIQLQRAKSAIQIIAVDDATIKQFGDYEIWSRSRTAQLIETLNNSGYTPSVIGIALDHTEIKNPESDQILVDTCKKYHNICFSSTITMESEDFKISKRQEKNGKNSNFLALSDFSTEISLPFPKLVPYIETGIINNMQNSPDGIARNAILSIVVNDKEYDSFAVKTYKMYRDSLEKDYVLPKVDDNNSFAFTYTRQSNDYNIYSFYDIISGNVDLSIFENSIVYVGDYTEDDSTFKVPNQRNIKMREIEVQANLLEALLTQRTGHPISSSFMAIFYSIFAAIFFIATSYSSNKKTILSAIILLLLFIATCGVLNLFGYYILILIPTGLVIIITIFNLFVRYWATKYSSYKMETTFKKYVDENVVEQIVQNGGKAQIGGVKKDIAVLFVDIRGFTSLSESLDPEQIVEILNQYLTLAAVAVFKYNGTLDKFIGDAAMAVFNSPTDLEDYEYRAVCAAWELLSSASELNNFCQKQYGKQVTFGIGIQCGEAVIGNIGCESRMDYTAIGDTVNTAARLEGIAAPGQILISEEMNERLKGRIQTNFAGEYTLKGKKHNVKVYALKGIWFPLPDEQDPFFKKEKVFSANINNQ